MTPNRSSEETSIIATYSTRRDAEMARDLLEDENLQVHIVADDAGGMHPHFQQTHGVRLITLRSEAGRARQILDEAGILPDAEVEEEGESPIQRAAVQHGLGTVFLVLGVAMVVLGGYGLFTGYTAVGMIVGVIGMGVVGAGRLVRRRSAATV